MASINKIDLSSITNKDSDVYVIDATTLDGKSVSDFALLNGNNMFTGSENYFQGTLAAEAVEVFGEINAKDFGAVWTLPGTAYIGEGIRFSTFDKGGTISAAVKGDLDDTTGVLQMETPYAWMHLGDSEITLEVDHPAILKLKDGHALMCAETKVEIYSDKDNALLEITPDEISIHNKASDPEDPVRLTYIGGEDWDELHVYCGAYFETQPIYYGPHYTPLDHRYVRYGRLPWSKFITNYITDTNSCSYDNVEIEINTILDHKILDGVDSYWISLNEFRHSDLFFRAALLDPWWLKLGLDGYTVSGLRIKFSGSSIRYFITHSDTQDENSFSVFTPDSTSDQYIYYRVYDRANYPLARDEEWSMSV